MTLVLLKFTCNLSLFATLYRALILFRRPAIGADNKIISSANNMIKILMSLIDTWLLYASVNNARLSISLKCHMGPCPTIMPSMPVSNNSAVCMTCIAQVRGGVSMICSIISRACHSFCENVPSCHKRTQDLWVFDSEVLMQALRRQNAYTGTALILFCAPKLYS